MTLALISAVLLGAGTTLPVQFAETGDSPPARAFVARVGGRRIQIERDGWRLLGRDGESNGGLRFRGVQRGAGLTAGQTTGSGAALSEVRETGVYPGVDLVYYGAGGRLEYDLVVAPGADPRRIQFAWSGSGAPKLDADGSLILPASGETVRLAAPRAYQVVGGARVAVGCRYAIRDGRIGFDVASYDRSRRLVIDPQIVFNSLSPNSIAGIAARPDGGCYVLGGNTAPTPGAYQAANGVALTKLDQTGRVVWSAAIGLSATNVSMAVDGSDHVYLAGSGIPGRIPSAADAFPADTTTALRTAGFVLKMSADGTQILYATLLSGPLFGGFGADQVTALTVSAEGQMTLAGTLFKPGPQSAGVAVPVRLPGSFVARISADGTRVLYSRLLTGDVTAVAIDEAGNAVAAGTSIRSDDAPVSLQPALADTTLYVSQDGGANVQGLSGLIRTTGIAIDPANPLSLLRSTSAGVFQSEDGGATWQIVDGLGADFFSTVWIHPRNPQLRFAVSSVLYRSEDGGATWQSVSAPFALLLSNFTDTGDLILGMSPFGWAAVSSDMGKSWTMLLGLLFINFTPISGTCAADPSDPQHFLIGSAGGSSSNWGVAETHDGGKSFRLLTRNPDATLAFEPKSSNVIYGADRALISGVASVASSASFVKSEDGGRTWRLPQSGVRIPTVQIAVDPSGSGRIYAFGPLGVYRSDDRGETWTHLPGEFSNSPLTGGTVSFGANDVVYAVAESQADGYLAKVDASGALVFSTLIGGRNKDQIQAVAIASNGDIIVGGTTQSDDLLAMAGAGVRTNGGLAQGFLARLTADGGSLEAFRYVGGSVADSIGNIALLSTGDVVAGGVIGSPDVPDALSYVSPPLFAGRNDGFVGLYSGLDLGVRSFTLAGSEFAGSIASLSATGTQVWALAAIVQSSGPNWLLVRMDFGQ